MRCSREVAGLEMPAPAGPAGPVIVRDLGRAWSEGLGQSVLMAQA
jgi:hypothetical protein